MSKIDFFVRQYLPDNVERSDPRISPYYADLRNLAPMHIQVASNERMYGDSALLHDKVISTGGDSQLYVAEDMWHVWQLFSNYIPESDEALRSAARFITQE